eukprot:380310-Hanusia_phi.AAC.2
MQPPQLLLEPLLLPLPQPRLAVPNSLRPSSPFVHLRSCQNLPPPDPPLPPLLRLPQVPGPLPQSSRLTRGLPSPCSASWLCLCVSDASSLASCRSKRGS